MVYRHRNTTANFNIQALHEHFTISIYILSVSKTEHKFNSSARRARFAAKVLTAAIAIPHTPFGNPFSHLRFVLFVPCEESSRVCMQHTPHMK